MKWSIALTAAVLLSSVQVAAAQDAAGAARRDFLAAPPRTEQASEMQAQKAIGTVAPSPARASAVVLVFVMMTVIAYRRLDRRAA